MAIRGHFVCFVSSPHSLIHHSPQQTDKLCPQQAHHKGHRAIPEHLGVYLPKKQLPICLARPILFFDLLAPKPDGRSLFSLSLSCSPAVLLSPCPLCESVHWCDSQRVCLPARVALHFTFFLFSSLLFSSLHFCSLRFTCWPVSSSRVHLLDILNSIV